MALDYQNFLEPCTYKLLDLLVSRPCVCFSWVIDTVVVLLSVAVAVVHTITVKVDVGVAEHTLLLLLRA